MDNVFAAKIILGEGKGKTLGFPTANLDKTDLDIDYGVYVASVKMKDKTYKGLLHFGLRKTFGGSVSLELYINNFNGNLYGQTVEVAIIKKIREIKKFKNAEELKGQIKKDVALFRRREYRAHKGFMCSDESRRKNLSRPRRDTPPLAAGRGSLEKYGN